MTQADTRRATPADLHPGTSAIIMHAGTAGTRATSGTASAFFKVLAYLPPTAPFAMPVLVGLRSVTWWEFGIGQQHGSWRDVILIERRSPVV